MLDYLLAGLSAGILVFLVLFIISFITLALITGLIHLTGAVYHDLFAGTVPTYRYRSSVTPMRRPESIQRFSLHPMHRSREAEFIAADAETKKPPVRVRRLSTLMGIQRPTYGDSSG